MRKWGAYLAVFSMLLIPAIANAEDAAVKAQIEAASEAMNQAFQRQDWDYVKANITQDHLSVFPAWGKPKSFSENLKVLGRSHHEADDPVRAHDHAAWPRRRHAYEHCEA